MAENVFTQRFCDIVKKQVCTTTAELDFDSFTAPGTYEIYEDIGSGQNRVYFLTVDKSASGKCTTQTRTHCGKVEYRHYTTAGAWTEWAEVTGGGNLDEKEDKSNKVDFLSESALNDPETEQYPTTYATMAAIVEQARSLDNSFEQKLEDKEDVANKISEWQENLSDEQYPSAPLVKEAVDTAKAMAEDGIAQAGQAQSLANEAIGIALSAQDAVQSKTAWELAIIKKPDGVITQAKDTLTEDIGTLTVNFEEKYKELYVRMIITTMNPDMDADFPKGRVAVYVANTINASKQVFMEQSPNIADTKGVPYPLNFHIELFGKYCRVHRQYASTMDDPHYTSSATSYTGYKDIKQEYIDAITLYYLPATRKFPVGTYYEIWGVRA